MSSAEILPGMLSVNAIFFFYSGDNPAHLNPHEDGAGHDSDVEEDAGNHTKPYRFYRTRIGSPSINRRSFTDEEIDRFIRKYFTIRPGEYIHIKGEHSKLKVIVFLFQGGQL